MLAAMLAGGAPHHAEPHACWLPDGELMLHDPPRSGEFHADDHEVDENQACPGFSGSTCNLWYQCDHHRSTSPPTIVDPPEIYDPPDEDDFDGGSAVPNALDSPKKPRGPRPSSWEYAL